MLRRLVRPLAEFLRQESASGLLLLACTISALWLANSPWSAAFADFWHTPGRVGVGVLELDGPLEFWVNDGLMTLFFLVVGLEVKRELAIGELRDPRKAALPILAAVGGMIVPATIYLLIERVGPGHAGWGIPTATDIAFVVGFLALLGRRVPFGLKILLLSLAIADDIGAVLIIAFAYTEELSLLALALAALGFGVICLFRSIGVRRWEIYVLVGLGIWLAFVKSGVHPTVAGVCLGLLTPAQPRSGNKRNAVSPFERLEAGLHPWVAFGIMPVFALANAGVPIGHGLVNSPVALAVISGLVIGKPFGIVLFSWLAVKLGLARLPSGVNWRIMLGAGSLAGIGFTMSLFIAALALGDDLLQEAKIGTLLGSAISAALGLLLLLCFLPAPYNGDKGPREQAGHD